jgi:pimeloyl-ACP methyl ester carboxylesterase
MVFVHGLGGDFTHFEHVAKAFAHSHRIIGVDMPGCGLSSKPTEKHTIRSHAEALLSLLDTLQLKTAILVGHSAGGLVCAQAALIAPSRVEQLVLVNAAGLRSYAAPLRWLAPRVLSPAILNAILEPSAHLILTQVFHKKNRYTEKFEYDAINRPTQPALRFMAKVFHDLSTDLLQPTVMLGAPSLTMPVLVIWGDKDRLVPLRTVKRVASMFPNGRLEVIPNCGHMPIIEDPEHTIAILRDFLDATQASRRAA